MSLSLGADINVGELYAKWNKDLTTGEVRMKDFLLNELGDLLTTYGKAAEFAIKDGTLTELNLEKFFLEIHEIAKLVTEVSKWFLLLFSKKELNPFALTAAFFGVLAATCTLITTGLKYA